MVQKTQVPKQAKNKTKAAAKEEDAKAKLVKQAAKGKPTCRLNHKHFGVALSSVSTIFVDTHSIKNSLSPTLAPNFFS